MGGYGLLLTRLIALGALAVSVLGGPYLQDHPGLERSFAIGLLLLVSVSVMLIRSGAVDPPILVPRRVEVAAIVVFTLAGGALCVLVPDGTAVSLPFIAAWFAPRVPVSRSFEIGLLCVDVVALWGFFLRSPTDWWPYPVALVGVIAAYQAGLRTRERAERVEFAELMLAREQALRSERERAAAGAERERIARDLHDVLAHTLSGLAITLQNASTLLQAGHPDQAQVQVDRARALAVEGQGEARQALAALQPPTGSGPAPADLAVGIDRVVRDHRAMTGGPVSLSLGRLMDVPPEVTSAALAVLREALTNVIRHAPNAPVTVSAYLTTPGSVDLALVLTVADDPGTAAPPPGLGGLGLTGMRSRVADVGGSLRAGPTSTGWSVELTVPLETHSGATDSATIQVSDSAAGPASR